MALPLLLAALAAEGVYRGVKGKREREQAEQLTQMRGQAAGDLIQGAGLPMGPMVDTTPAEQQQLGGIARGMASPFEDVREQAFGQLESLSPQAVADLQKTQLGNRRQELEIAAMQNPQVVADPEFTAAVANQLRDERRTDMKPIRDSLRTFADVESLLIPAMQGGLQSGPAALNILFRYISNLDNSVVRPSEAEALRGGTGIAGQFVSMYNEILGQGFITPEMARQMYEAAATVAQQTQAAGEDIMQLHNEQAARFIEQYPGFGEGFTALTGGGSFRSRTFDIPTTTGGGGGNGQGAVEGLDPDRYEAVDY